MPGYVGDPNNQLPPSGGGDGGGIAGAIIQTGAALYDSHQDRKLSRENTRRTIDANKAEAELAYQRSIDMWNMQNQYNTPQAQMQRFLDAGLNPHLIYGQGNPGNAGTPPNYSPPDIQYRFQSGKFGEAVGSFLPTLMAVGSWMQNMRATEAGIKKTEVETRRADTTVEQMLRMNPEILKKIQGEVSLLPGQKALQDLQRDKMVQVMQDLETEFRQKYGDELWKQFPSAFDYGSGGPAPIKGTKALEFLQAKQKLAQGAQGLSLGEQKLAQGESRTKLMEAQASWADLDITNPQQIMMLVLNSVLGLAGGSMKLAGKAKPSVSQTRARPTGLKKRKQMEPSERAAQEWYNKVRNRNNRD